MQTRFLATRVIRVCFEFDLHSLLKIKYLSEDLILCCDSSVFLSIPSVTVLDVLAKSCNKNFKKEDIIWNDGHICTKATRPTEKDGITAILWPLVYDIKKDLNKKEISLADNLDRIRAMLCQNTEEENIIIHNLLAKKIDQKIEKKMKLIKSKILNLVIQMNRTGPFKNGFQTVLMYNYQENEGDEPNNSTLPESDEDIGESTPLNLSRSAD